MYSPRCVINYYNVIVYYYRFYVIQMLYKHIILYVFTNNLLCYI